MREEAHVGELPPRPDPHTGEPRPPRAPGFTMEEKPPKDADAGRERNERRRPSPPAGEGPVLEWYRHSQRRAVRIAVFGFVFFVLGMTAIEGFSFSWARAWPVWVVLVLGALGVYSSLRSVDAAVGAEWLKVGRRWVRLYELTEVKAKHRGNAIHLDMKDRAGRENWIKLDDLQEDRDLWDLVYNGILHSVVLNGAKTNDTLHWAVGVPRPPQR